MKKLATLALGIALFLGLAAPRSARADSVPTGYICWFYNSSPASVYGNYGSVAATVYSGPACTGTYLGSAVFSTTGATACPAWSSMSEARLISIAQNLAAAATQSTKVSITANTYNGQNCAANLFVYGK
jgi:hypothetical protein